MRLTGSGGPRCAGGKGVWRGWVRVGVGVRIRVRVKVRVMVGV